MKSGTPSYEMNETQQMILQAVENLAQTCQSELDHTHQVTKLSLRLFDELYSLHHCGEQERFWLECAARLHDIGWVEGVQGHHKTSLRIILESPLLPLDNKERLLIGSIARYHRRALPSIKHPHYAALQPVERKTVCRLASILRIADGLDASHLNLVEDVKCALLPEEVLIRCKAAHSLKAEKESVIKKSDLFVKTFHRKVILAAS
jgi:exopolyphosphatase/guanosine-5'-triphosphate,3'-diphosphate pyrophosphatase